MLSAMWSRRFWTIWLTGPKTHFFMIQRVMRNITRVQIMRPGLASSSGLLPLSLASACNSGRYAVRVPIRISV